MPTIKPANTWGKASGMRNIPVARVDKISTQIRIQILGVKPRCEDNSFSKFLTGVIKFVSRSTGSYAPSLLDQMGIRFLDLSFHPL
jgi:hypothetical protein